jgi:serine phosphatase RsbU (regulator of sigma subunit)
LCFILIVLADLSTSRNQNFSSLFILIPVLLALEWGPVVVLLGSVPLVVLTATQMAFTDSEPTEVIVVRTIGVGVGVAIGSYLALFRESRESKLTYSRAAALATQEAILPVVPSAIGPLRFACAYHAAADESHIGGDFYKAVDTIAGTRLALGDVRGKGLEAITMTAAVLGCFREWAPEAATLKSLVERLDARVVDKSRPGDFVTCVVASVDKNLTMEVVNCGHPSPVLLRSQGGGAISPERRTTPLGMEPDPEVVRVPLAPGDRVLFYTDGLIECRDRAGKWIELDGPMLAAVATDPLSEALPNLIDRVEERAGSINDDIALLLVEVSAHHDA